MDKKWITFDLDGTLMQNPFGNWVFPEIAKMAESFLGDDNEIISELVQEHQKRMESGDIVNAYDWDDIVQKVFAISGVPITIDVGEMVIKHSIPSKVYLLEEGILEILYGLRDSGFSLAVITNGFEKYQKPVMDVLRLTHAFDAIITPEKVGFGKPQVEMVKGLLEADNEIIAHIGDRLDHDVVLANKLGILSVLIYQKMPDGMKHADIPKRIGMKESLNWLRNKWERETNEKTLPMNAIPKIMIHSIKEINRESLKF
ncbi:HAD family hydrolase [Paucisalibacillus globulus]|uniref:HAD family hydrolase n=1 Tax=Paucisalibacillus globulus TaxID=351095 RepID=UPI00042975A8|nr:HAD family hydrolase [Paucisalibacillus globulus]